MKNIKEEYNGKWKTVLDQVYKEKTDDFILLHELINKTGINSNLKKFLNNNWYIYDNKINNITLEKVYYYKHLFLTNILIKKLTGFQEIIELGSGWGSRILYINEILNIKSFSGEINNFGLETQKQIIKKCNLQNIECFHFDYNNFNNVEFPFKLTNPAIITCNSIEQIENISETFYSDLKDYLKVTELNIFHLEPIGFQFDPTHNLDENHRDYNKINKYNLNIGSVITNLNYEMLEVDKNILTCESEDKTIFSPMSLVSIKY